ncbi:hypothetical protein, partial [Escherichia coli]
GNPGRFRGNVGVQVADRGYNDTSAMVGIKWQF